MFSPLPDSPTLSEYLSPSTIKEIWPDRKKGSNDGFELKLNHMKIELENMENDTGNFNERKSPEELEQ